MRKGVNNPTMSMAPVDLDDLRERLTALYPANVDGSPDISVAVPVNAQGDLSNVLYLLDDIARYAGSLSAEVILVVNNYPATDPPPEIAEFENLGIRVVAIPNVRKPGEAVGFSARIPGVQMASAPFVVLFDADCRIPDSTALLDWYAEQFRWGAKAAYTHVAYYDFADALSIRFRFALHHYARWVKRNILRIPTTRGSNYGVDRAAMLALYQQGLLADEMNVGPTFKRLEGPVIYSGNRRLTVYTSGRMFRVGWRRIVPYFLNRLRYNLRVLPVRAGVARHTGRERDPERRYDRDNRPVRTVE